MPSSEPCVFLAQQAAGQDQWKLCVPPCEGSPDRSTAGTCRWSRLVPQLGGWQHAGQDSPDEGQQVDQAAYKREACMCMHINTIVDAIWQKISRGKPALGLISPSTAATM